MKKIHQALITISSLIIILRIARRHRDRPREIYGEENLINHQDVDVNINPTISKNEASQLFVEKTRNYGGRMPRDIKRCF